MTKYVVSYQATFTVDAESADAAVDLIPTDTVNRIESGEIESVRVDGHDWDLAMPPGCSQVTFPGSRLDPPEHCENEVARWDEHGDAWCSIHSAQPDDGPFGEDD